MRADCYGPAEFAAARELGQRRQQCITSKEAWEDGARSSRAPKGANCTVPQFLVGSCLESLKTYIAQTVGSCTAP